MAANKYISLVSGKLQETLASSTGTANALVAGNAAGTLDPSWLPAGVVPAVIVVPASVTLAAGQFVNLFNNSGVLSARLANATTNTTSAQGFVLAAVTSGANATVYLLGQVNNALTGLTIGAEYWLDVTAGAISTTPPSSTGNIVQYIGVALSATSILFDNIQTIQRA